MDSSNGSVVHDPCVSIISALRVIKETTSNNADRSAATSFLEEVKSRAAPAELASFAFTLSGANQEDHIRHFGLGLLEFYLKKHWLTFQPEEVEEIKNGLIGLMGQTGRSLVEEPTFLQEKMASVVVVVVKRTWPQNWPDLLDQLVALSDLGESQLVRVSALLRAICEETYVFHGELPEKRRRELSSTLQASLESIIALLYRHLEAECGAFSQGGNDVSIRNRTVTAILRTLLVFADVIPFAIVFKFTLVPILLWLVTIRSFRGIAVDCLLVLFSRKPPVEDSLVIVTLHHVTNAVFDLATSFSSEFDEEEYDFQKRLVQAICQFGSTWVRSANTATLPVAGAEQVVSPRADLLRFFEVVLAFACHSSYLLSSFTVEVWGTLFRSLQMADVRTVVWESFADVFLSFLLSKLGAVDTSLRVEGSHSPFVLVDFDDAKEFGKFLDTYRSQLIHLVRNIAHVEATGLVQWSVEKLASVVAENRSRVATQGRDGEEFMDRFDPFLVTYGAAAFLCELVLSITPSKMWEKEFGTNPTELVKELTSMMVSTRDPELLIRQISAVIAFAPYLQLHQEIVPPFLDQIFARIVFRIPEDENVDLYELNVRSVRVRRKSCTALIQMSKSMPDALLPHLDLLAKKVRELFPDLLHTERIGLCEALVLLANRVPDVASRAQLSKELLAHPMESWQSEEVSDAVLSWRKLIDFAHVKSDLKGFLHRKMVSVPLYTFLAMCKRTIPPDPEQGIHPLYEFVHIMLERVVPLCSSIHSLWTPEVLASIPQDVAADIVALSPYEKAALMGEEIPPEGVDLATWLYNVRCACYDLFGEFMRFPNLFVLVEQFPMLMQQSVFHEVQHMELRHFRCLLQLTINRFVRHCPDSHFNFFDAALGFVMAEAWTRLDSAFQTRLERTESPSDEGNEVSEVEEDKIVQKFAQDVFEVLHRLVSPAKDGQKASISPRFRRLLVEGVHSVQPILYLFINGLWWPNAFVRTRALILCGKIVEYSQADARFVDVVGRDMFSACLKGILEASNRDNHAALSSLMGEIYCSLYLQTAHVTELMLHFPDVTPEVLSSFNESIEKEKSPKKRTRDFTVFLRDVCHVDISQVKKPSILDIPQKLFISKPDNVDLSSEKAIKALFLSTQYDLPQDDDERPVGEESPAISPSAR